MPGAIDRLWVIVALMACTLPSPQIHMPVVRSLPFGVPLAFAPWQVAHLPSAASP